MIFDNSVYTRAVLGYDDNKFNDNGDKMTDNVNIPVLRKAVEWVEEQDKFPAETRSWNQYGIITSEEYRVRSLKHEQGCGTGYCIAGYIAETFAPEELAAGQPVIRTAMRVLNLTLHDLITTGQTLFAAENSAAQIRTYAEKLAGEKL